MASSSTSSMRLRERVTDERTKLRRSVTASERSQDSSDNSSRETKRARKNGAKKGEFRGAKFDSSGIHKESQKDLCDCLNVECCGCFITCPRCASLKCGHECRRNRRWIYESIDIEGTNLTVKNKFKK